MELSQFKAVAKPRNAWQAIDLGIVMARSCYLKMFLACFIPAMFFYVVLMFTMWDYATWSALLLWWLKPLWERPALYIISREVFAESVTLRQVWRNYWGIIKTDLLWWLSLRRLSPSRGFDMPVTMLEQLKGSVRQKRLSVLHRRFTNGATWLLVAGIHIETFITFGVVTAIYMLIPQGVEVNWSELFMDENIYMTQAYNLIYVAIMAAVMPFYVCSGFALYLQRRIELEGWDIEIRFRDLTDRQLKRKKRFSRTAASLLPMLLLFSVLFQSTSTKANDSTQLEANETIATPSAAQQQAKQEIVDILTSEDFQNIESKTDWRFKKQGDDEEDNGIPDWLLNFAEWLDNNGGFLSGIGDFFRSTAKLFELVLWILAISIVLYLIFRYKHLVANLVRGTAESDELKVEPPKVLFGLDVSEESIPDDVVGSAQEAWQAGNQRQALGILLRSSIIKLIHDYKYPFYEGNTEKECAQIVEKQGKQNFSEFFWPLTRTWQALAYAHRECSAETFDSLCQKWNEVFTNAQ